MPDLVEIVARLWGTEISQDFNKVLRAAHAVAEAETVTICATHRWPPLPSVSHTCMKGLPGAPSDPLPEPCSMVERLLVDPGKLQ